MIIKLKKDDGFWYFKINDNKYTQKQFDYVYKYLDFDKLDKIHFIYFNNKKTQEWFHKTYIDSYALDQIHNQSPEGYAWLNENWGKGVFKLYIYYSDKQEFKTIINKVINIELIIGNK